MISNDKILNPGDIVIETMSIQSAAGATLDVKSQFVALNIYEDLFSNGMSGFLVLIDSLNLPRYLQMTGRETLKVVFNTPGDSSGNDIIERYFNIYKVTSETKLVGDGKKLVRIEFVSSPVYENAKLRVSRSFTDMRYSEMVQILGRDIFNMEINCCPTLGRKNIIIPNWNPMYAISWLAKRSSAEMFPEACDYVFYETLSGRYNFMSLAVLKAQEASVKYHHTPANRDPITGEVMLKKEFYNIISLSVGGRGDKMREIVSGVYANNALALDVLGKRAYTEAYTYFTQRDKIPNISKYPLIPKFTDDLSFNITAYQKYYPKHSYRYDTVEDNDELHLVSTRRQSQMNQMKTNTLMAVISGDSRRRVGEIISLDVQGTENPKNKDDSYDPYLSGRYMITAILHEIGDGSYNMKMELARDGVDERLPEVQSFSRSGEF